MSSAAHRKRSSAVMLMMLLGSTGCPKPQPPKSPDDEPDPQVYDTAGAPADAAVDDRRRTGAV